MISGMGSKFRGRPHRLVTGAVATLLGVLAAACVSTNAVSGPDNIPENAPLDRPQYSGFVTATEFVVGENRFPFALLSVDGGPLENARVQVSFYSLEKELTDYRIEAPAKFHKVTGVTPHRHEDGADHQHVETRGVYVVDRVSFDRPGFWGAQFAVATDGGEQPQAQGVAFSVLGEPQAPGLGETVPATRNLTLSDVGSIDEIETRVPPDNMHDLSVAQALEGDKPFVVVFATPMFCVSRMCGPVTDVAAELHGRFKDRVNFIHIEPWDLEVARSEGRLAPVDVFLEWNLPSEPWVFVVGRDGRVSARFEGLVSTEELENAIVALVGGDGSG
jgi:hypothetical protein